MATLLLVVAFLVLPLAAAEAVRPVAPVSISGPHEVFVEGGETIAFQLHVASRLECASGLKPPRDLLVRPAAPSPQNEERPWHVEPASVRVAWKPSPGEPNVYLIDSLVTFNVTSDVVPAAPVETATELLVEEVQDQRPGLSCQVDGYDLEVEDFALAFVVVPPEAGADAASAQVGDHPRVRWVPMGLAVVILASLAAFATLREHQRRRGD